MGLRSDTVCPHLHFSINMEMKILFLGMHFNMVHFKSAQPVKAMRLAASQRRGNEAELVIGVVSAGKLG